MKFKFDASQEHQVDAVEAVCSLFEGQPLRDVSLSFELGSGFGAVANQLDLDEANLLTNLQQVQRGDDDDDDSSALAVDDELKTLEAAIETASGPKTSRFFNFSVEMETGTGKTYVYIRTALELFQRYGFRKFIIVVPSVAIREGVLKDLRLTRDHFEELYGNLPYRFYVYNSASLAQVRQFAVSDSVELMVMTIDSFNKASNVIRQTTDRLQGETPIHLIQATRPILILDEPQNMESELRIQALAALDPAFALRYSATHRNPYNLTYRLTPFEAYRQRLVKEIEVASVVEEDEESQPFVQVSRIDAKKRTLTARVMVHKLMKTGTVKEATVTVRPGDSLEEKAGGRVEYQGYEVDEISAAGGFVRFANNTEVRVGEAVGFDREALFESQIAYTIEEHFRKQERLAAAGVKVLSLFFIDRVANYVQDNGVIRKLFNESFRRLSSKYERWSGVDPESVQAGYFAARRRREGVTEYVDSVSGETKEDEAAYELIMRSKERLLSLDESVAFIFSHSALREGWDNPNVFQICTLNQTASELKKRQEVGRGIRLCRDQAGQLVHDERINVLTVVANEAYERYVGQLQTEIEDEYGAEGVPPKPPNARRPGYAKLRKNFTLKPEFKELWERIRHRTRYAVTIDSDKLVDEVVARLDRVKVRPPRVSIRKVQLRAADDEDAFEAIQMSAAKTALDLVGRYPLPNLIDIMASLMEHTSPPVHLTRATLLRLVEKTTNRGAAVANPHDFATEAVRILKESLADHLVNGIQYDKIDEWYEMTQLDTEIKSWEQYLVPVQRSLYDHVIFDSQIERDFVEGLEKRKDVKLYLKLPNWFTVPTPVGEYNPDWAIVMDDRDAHGDPTGKPLLYLVRETKDANFRKNARGTERRKVICGQRHFEGALGVDFKVVTRANELP